MKPLPLLCTLCVATAILGGFLLITKPGGSGEREPSPIPAPLPPSFAIEEEELEELPVTPLLTDDLTPAPELIAFAENFLGERFQQPPIFKAVTLDELVEFVSTEIAQEFKPERRKQLETLAGALGIAPEFQPLSQSLITVVAGEVRGLVSGDSNLILNDFFPESPPEQAALVNLLLQRLFLQLSPAPAFDSASVDEILAHRLLVQTAAFLGERAFRETLPDYPPSLHENIREAILVGLPDFIYELSAFSEFHLATRLSQPSPRDALEEILQNYEAEALLSRLLLDYPDHAGTLTEERSYQLGPIVLYLLTLKNGNPESTAELARALRADRLQSSGDELVWTLSFEDEAQAQAAQNSLESALPFRYSPQAVRMERDGTTLRFICTRKP